jgi:hypothetical protein
MKVRPLLLVVHLSILFGILIVVTVTAITWESYERSKEQIELHGEPLSE